MCNALLLPGATTSRSPRAGAACSGSGDRASGSTGSRKRTRSGPAVGGSDHRLTSGCAQVRRIRTSELVGIGQPRRRRQERTTTDHDRDAYKLPKRVVEAATTFIRMSHHGSRSHDCPKSAGDVGYAAQHGPSRRSLWGSPRSVKALRCASTPLRGAHGLDRSSVEPGIGIYVMARAQTTRG